MICKVEMINNEQVLFPACMALAPLPLCALDAAFLPLRRGKKVLKVAGIEK